MTRILVVQESDWLERNPVQQHHMVERLSAEGHEVLVLDYPIQWREQEGKLWSRRRVHTNVSRLIPGAVVTVVRSGYLRVSGIGKLSWLATNTWEIARALRSFRPDVVVALGLSNGLIALGLATLFGTPFVVHLIDALHTLAAPAVLRPPAALAERAILRGADRVVVINKALGAYAISMGARPDRIAVIPAGADTTSLGPHVDGTRLRAAHGIGAEECVLLFVGWLYTFSGLREVAELMAASPASRSALRLLVVGDGDLTPELRRLRDERLGDRLILTGKQPPSSIPEYVAASDICLLPARANETMRHIVPAKVYEYLTAGKPILATPLMGLRMEFGDASGITYVSGAEELLAAALRLASNAAGRSALGAAARRRAEDNGNWDAVTARFLGVLNDTILMRGRAIPLKA